MGGSYRLLNVFGAPVETVVAVASGDVLPPEPRGHTWELIIGTSPFSDDNLGER
jgi:hypothetical protein